MTTEREGEGPPRFEPIPHVQDRIAAQVVDAAYHVHKQLGPGLVEEVYEICMCYEMKKRGLSFKRQVPVPVVYDGIKLDVRLRLDMVVADCVIVELKAVEKVNPVFEAQLLTYLKLSNRRLGLLINFNVSRIKDGIQRVVL